MMKTVSLSTAKLLREAGWKQRKTEQHWYIYKGKTPKIDVGLSVSNLDWLQKKDWDCFDAPDVSELLEALPDKTGLIQQAGKTWAFVVDKYDVGGFAFNLYIDDYPDGVVADTPAEALAALWITLKKQGLLEKGRERV